MVDFLIIGAQKCGTTSLHRYLSAHPEIDMPSSKELAFFYNDEYFSRGLQYYERFFPKLNKEGFISGEASPQYMYNSKVAERINALYPRARLIMSLRNPLDRAISHFKMNKRRGIESRTFAKAAEDFIECGASLHEDPEYAYFTLGEYGRVLSDYLKYFPIDQILITYSGDLRHNREAELTRILEFLGKENKIPKEKTEIEYHVSGVQRIPKLGNAIKYLSKISPKLNSFLKLMIGTKRVYYLLHKIETEWNIRSDEPGELDVLPERLQDHIVRHFVSDQKVFTSLSGVSSPWRFDN